MKLLVCQFVNEAFKIGQFFTSFGDFVTDFFQP